MTKSSGSRAIATMLAIATAIAIAGCSSPPTDQPPLGRVRGKITLDGQPLAGVEVVFAPERGRHSMATTDAGGRYDLTYVNATKGAKVGPHKVSIRPTEYPVGEAPTDASSGGAPAGPPPKIPAKYNKRSTLTAEVKSGKNTIDFQLESK